jgi:3-methylcrotonyl-CoA carboxylase alpha subunit
VFESILIANRGEIACRIIRTAKRLGVRTVAVYSDADADALHVRLADSAFHIGPAPAAESYLLGERVIEAAKRGGVDAIHPGYGFLSENADFAEACAREGLTFIGPPPSAIREMGAKDAAKARMELAGVPIVPGYHGDAQDNAALGRAAEDVGYPLLVKAVAGGGGRGMRRVDRAEDLSAALDSARREAESGFGDPRLLLERFIEQARHIEVQVFADAHGGCVHLFERDCSIQRRHQKVVEEAPAPGLGEARRAELGAAAVRAASAIDYRGAGTIEFIVDSSVPIGEAPFYFMEMNTRLQVEHPVTEAITGFDLVEWQLRVAAGEALPEAASTAAIQGHAIEVRVYAEDPARGYLPQSGPLVLLRPPAEREGVRVDTGFLEGDRVGVHYDPMIAKLIAHGRDRDEALARLRGALADYAIAGIRTNIDLLGRIAAHPAFIAGEVDTAFLERHADQVVPSPEAPADLIALICAGHLCARARAAREATLPSDPHSPWSTTDSFRLNGRRVDRLRLADGKREIEIQVEFDRDAATAATLSWDDQQEHFEAMQLEGDRLSVVRDGIRSASHYVESGDDLYVTKAGQAWMLRHIVEDPEASGGAAGGGAVIAPMPGKIIAVSVENGQRVKVGDPLLTLEAMKMEHVLRSPQRGHVEGLEVGVDEQVAEGTILLTVKAG